MEYYDGTKLLSLKDNNKEDPEIYICAGNRTAGKTVYFSRFLVNKFLKDHSKFMLLYRYSYELTGCADMFFKDIKNLFFPGYTMEAKVMDKGCYAVLSLVKDDTPEVCGYAVPLNSADAIKKRSHLFVDVDRIFFDEFQSETGHYCPNELKKFQSIHVSVARGGGKTTRRVPVYMCSNSVSILNPYYSALGITERLKSDTKFIRGDGWVFEQTYNSNAAEALKESAFMRAFAGDSYLAYATQNVYLNDNTAFIEKPIGRSRYICTLKYNEEFFGVRAYDSIGLVFVDTSFDESYPVKIAVTLGDHNIGYSLKSYAYLYTEMETCFNNGMIRFKNQKAKAAFLAYLCGKYL